MLTMRPSQNRAFDDAAFRRFEDEMLEHLKEFAPCHCAVIGERIMWEAKSRYMQP